LGGGGNKIGRKVFRQNIEKGSQKLFGHPLTLKVHLHGKHPCLMHLVKRKKFLKSNPKKTPKTPNIIWKVTKIGRRKETRRQTTRWPRHAFARLDHKPHKNQLKNKMFKNKQNDINKANDVNVIIKGRENTKWTNFQWLS